MGAICGKEKSSSRNVKPSQQPAAQPTTSVAAAAAPSHNNNTTAVASQPTTSNKHEKESVSSTSNNTTTAAATTSHSTKEQEYAHKKEEEEKEHQRTEELYKKGQANLDKIAKERDELHKQADAAFESGDKSKGHELREKAKNKTQELEKASKEASRSVFTAKNAKNDKYTVDLHGLHANDAIELLTERMEELIAAGSKGKQFTIITGAGNHSDKSGPKIKPMVHALIKEKGYSFEEINNGSIQCVL